MNESRREAVNAELIEEARKLPNAERLALIEVLGNPKEYREMPASELKKAFECLVSEKR